jgi:SPP1 family predicted phage head-tail adaptor
MRRPVTASELTEQITLQVRADGTDAHGQESTTWTDLATVRARAEPLRGRDFFAAAQTQSGLSVRFSIRYRTDVLATTRVLWDGSAYDIQGPPINVDGRRHTLELMCESGVRDGR